MTRDVFGGTLSLTQSINQSFAKAGFLRKWPLKLDVHVTKLVTTVCTCFESNVCERVISLMTLLTCIVQEYRYGCRRNLLLSNIVAAIQILACLLNVLT